VLTQLPKTHLDAYISSFTEVPAAEHVDWKPETPQRPGAGGQILWCSGAVVALILVLQVLPYAGAVTLGSLTLWACRNTRCALQAATISVLLTFANPALVGEQPMVGLLKWVLLFACLGTVLFGWRHQPGRAPRWLWCFLLFIAVALGLACAVSDDLMVSLLKLTTFAAGLTVALLGVRDRRYPAQYWLSWFATVGVVVLVLSAPLDLLPAGRYLNGTGFQGIFIHPQSYAVYMVPLTVFLTVSLFVESRKNWFLLAVVPWAWYSIFASGCRTALLAAGLASLATAVCLIAFPRMKRGHKQQGPMLLKICFAGLLASVVVATSTSALSSAFAEFIEKGDRNGVVGSSRVMQVQALLSSIEANLLTGVGFGLAAAGTEQETQRDELTGLPIGTSTEQGFLPLAVLAQVGIIGALPLTLFLCVLGIPVVKHGEPAVVAMFFTALFVNFGEMIFFSTGGLGLHMWLLIGACLAASAANSVRQKRCA
jgi:O-Antigen ligase